MNLSLPGISIIVPTFKRVEQTRNTLSLLCQSNGWNSQFFPEVILADSTEDQSIKNLASEFNNPTPVYVAPVVPGIATNKNLGAKTAQNELLIFCDSDMEVESDTLINTLIYLKEHNNSAMVTGQVIWKGGERDGQLDRPRKEDRMEKIDETIFVEAIYSRYMATYKSLFWRVGGYDEKLFNMRGEGSDLSIRYWRSGLPLSYDEKIKVHHVHDAQSSATRSIENPERGIIRDLILLGFKYQISRLDSPNFAKTLNWLTDQFGYRDKYIVIESMIALLPYFWENKERMEKSRQGVPNAYDFKFLDVFTKRELFLECIKQASERIREARVKVFK